MNAKPRKDGAVKVQTGVWRLPDNRYIIQWRDYWGNRLTEITGTNKLAAVALYNKRMIERFEKRRFKIETESTKKNRDLIAEYIKCYAQGRKISWKTDVGRLRHFERLCGDLPVLETKRKDIEGYMSKRQTETFRGVPISGGTINKEVAVIRKMYNKAIDWEWLESNPAARLERLIENPVDDSYLEFSEYEALLTAAQRMVDRGPQGKHWRSYPHICKFIYLIPLAYQTGGRRSEMLNLKREDFNWTQRLVRYRYRKGRRPEEKTRWVPMTSDLCSHLMRVINDPKREGPYLFPDETGGLWKAKRSFYNAFNAITEEAGMTEVDFHRLRHSYNSQLANNGVDREHRKELMGHSSNTTQDRYTHLADKISRATAGIFAKGTKTMASSWQVGPETGVKDGSAERENESKK